MKKIILFIISFILLMPFIKADCTYKEMTELSKLANYVESNYEFSETNFNFTLKFTNVPKELYVLIDNEKYYSGVDNTLEIKNIDFGRNLKVTINGSKYSECFDESYRTINIQIPYYNHFYGNDMCIGHESLDVCSYRFLPYDIDMNTFNRLILKNSQSESVEEEEEEEVVENKEEKITFKEIGVDYIIPVLLVLLSGGVTFLIGKIIYSKQKHGI